MTIKELIAYPRVPSLPARDLPVRRLVRQDQGRADALGHVPGAARHPHRRLADLEDPRAQDPRHRARHRRRLRQQGRRLFGLHLRDRRLDRHRRAGEMGRGPHREPLDHGLRARLPHDDRNRRDQGRQGDGAALLHHRGPWRVRRLRQRHQVAGRAVQHHHRLVRLPGRACARSTASTPTRRRAASPIAARSASPRRPTASSAPWTSWRRSSAWTRPSSGMKNLIRREQFPYKSAIGWEYDSGDYQTAMRRRWSCRLQEAARGAEDKAGSLQARRDARADGHRRRVLHRDRRRRSVAQPATSSASRCSTRPRSASIRPAAASAGSAPSRKGRATRPPTRRSSRPSSASPADNIMVEEGNTDTAPYGLGTYGSRSTPVSGAATAMACRKIKAKAQMIAAYMLEVHDDDLEWDVDRFRVKRQSRALQDHDRARLGGLSRGAARHGAGARGDQLLRSAEFHLPVRRLYLRRWMSMSTPARRRSAASTRSTIAARASTR